MKKYENMYPQINIVAKKGIYSYPIFLVRRLIFIVIPTLLFESRGLRIQLLYILMFAFSVYFIKHYILSRPIVRMEAFNETILYLLVVLLFCFSNYIDNRDM